jgi:integrase
MALCSLRRSEILAVKWSDVDLTAGTIQVHGSMVPDEENNLIYKKENKNRASRRIVPIMIPQLKDALSAAAGPPDDFVVTMHPSSILNGINKICEKANLPQVGIHGLRHSYASLSYSLNVPEKIAQKIGGWQDDATMRKIYTHVAQKDLTKYQDIMSTYYSNGITNKN